MPTLLPDYFERDLLRSVQMVAENALPNADPDSLNALAQDFQSAFDSAMVSIFRAYNSKHSRQQALPNEILCLIWEYLPLEDVLSVSHVCHLWRSVSIHCPRLWTALRFWSSVHEEDCDCEDCCSPDGLDESDSISVDMSICDIDDVDDGSDESSAVMLTTGRSNLDEVIALLPRSHSLLFTLQITVSALCTDLDVIEQLAQSLLPHYHRVTFIKFYSGGSEVPHAFFPYFESLPMLNCLVVESRMDEQNGGLGLLQISDGKERLLLPSLKRLVLTAGLGIVPEFTHSLTVLRLPFSSARQLLAYIRQAPRLQHLMLLLTHRYPRGRNNPDFSALKNECTRVPRVDVINIHDSTNIDHAWQLLDAQNRELKFSFSRACDYTGFRVLATVPRPEWFQLVRRPEDKDERLAFSLPSMHTAERLVLSLGDGAHKRTLSLPFADCHNDPALTAKWDAHPAQLRAPTATVDLALLPRVPPRVAAMVTALVVEMPASAATAGPPPDGVPAFPALETVEFQIGPPQGSPAQYSESTILDVAQLLRRGADRKLRTVVIGGAFLDSDGSLLSRIAADVVIVNRRS